MRVRLFLEIAMVPLFANSQGATCTDPGSISALAKREFGLTFTPMTAEAKFYADVSPRFVCGDFNGDGQTDFAVLGVIPVGVKPSEILERASVYKALPTGMSTKELRPSLDKRQLEGHIGSTALYVLFSKRVVGNRTAFQRMALASAFGPLDAERMVLLNGPIPQSEDPMALHIAPPKLKGAAIALLNKRGRGSILYWDGRIFRYYFINIS